MVLKSSHSYVAIVVGIFLFVYFQFILKLFVFDLDLRNPIGLFADF